MIETLANILKRISEFEQKTEARGNMDLDEARSLIQTIEAIVIGALDKATGITEDNVPLRKLEEIPKWRAQQAPCTHPEHNPPGNIVLEPGTYEHTCPSCGAKRLFRVGAVWT
jgi:hypothetical protein